MHNKYQIPTRYHFYAMALLLLAVIIVFSMTEIIMPFIVGIVIAYIFDPLVDRLERKIPRFLATIIVILLILLILGLFVFLILPPLVAQAANFFEKVPEYISALTDWLNNTLTVYRDRLPAFIANQIPEGNINIQNIFKDKGSQVLEQKSDEIFGLSLGVLKTVWSGSMALVNAISFIAITPIVTFFFLKDFDKIREKSFNLVPPRYHSAATELFSKINLVISGFFRGQVAICLFLATFYSIGLTLAGLDYGFLIGFFSGVFAFVPYVGTIVGGLAAILVSLLQKGELFYTLIILAIFSLGQFLEGNFLTPKIMSKNIGLHPVWIIFALIFAVNVAGFWGMIFAVPISAIIGVIVKHFMQYYLETDFYTKQ